MAKIKPPIEEWLITCNIAASDRTPLVINDIPNQIKLTKLGQTINVLDPVLYPNNTSAHIFSSKTISGYASKNQIILGEYLHAHTDIDVSAGTNGTSGTSGTSGEDGSVGENGTSGTSGTSGDSGSSGSSGTSGTSISTDSLLLFRGTNNTDRITSTTTLNKGHEVIFCDTDNGEFTINLPLGIEGKHYKIINCGSSGKNLTIKPYGTEQLYGGGAGVSFSLIDAEIIDIHYNSIEGWW